MKVEQVSKERLRRMAARWHDVGSSGRTYCLPPGQAAPSHLELPSEVRELIDSSETGAILFWSLGGSHLFLPPFPVARTVEYQGWHAGPLQSILDKPRRIGVLLLRLGGYAVGIFEGERLAASKVGSPFVKGRHRAGGSSSGRFARRREGQARHLFDVACEHLREVVEAYPHGLEHFILGGDRLTLLAFEKRCGYLRRFDGIRLRRVMDVQEPRLEVLKDVPRLVYMSRLVTFTPQLRDAVPEENRRAGLSPAPTTRDVDS